MKTMSGQDNSWTWKGSFVLFFAILMILVILLQDKTLSFAGHSEIREDVPVLNPNLNPNGESGHRHEMKRDNEREQKKKKKEDSGGALPKGSSSAGVTNKIPSGSDTTGKSGASENSNSDTTEEAAENVIPLAKNIVERDKNTSLCACVKRSSLISPACSNTKFDRKFPILFTGVGRSGTDFIHSELQAMGLRVSHDSNIGYGRIDGSVAWPEAFNAKPFYTHSARTKKAKTRRCKHEWWNFGTRWYGYYHVFHQVRHPLKTIQSRFNMGDIESFEMSSLCNTATRTKRSLSLMDRRLDKTMQHWTLWNSFVEQHAEFRFRIEQLNSPEKHDILATLLRLSGLSKLKLKGVNFTAVEASIDKVKVSTRKNSKHTKKSEERLSWKKLADINPEFTAMTQIQAMRYGYEVPKEELVSFVWDRCDPKSFKVQRCFIEYYEGRWGCALYSDKCEKDGS